MKGEVILRSLFLIVIAAVLSGCGHGAGTRDVADVQTRVEAEALQDDLSRWLQADPARRGFEIHQISIDPRNVVVARTSDSQQVSALNKRLRKRYGDTIRVEYEPPAQLA